MIEIITDTPNLLYESVAKAAYENLDLKGRASVELLIVDKDEIRKVNARERKIDSATDVLSFPLLDEILSFEKANYPFDYDEDTGCVSLGSILICDEVAKLQAAEYGHSEERERAYLFLHGLLHLLGYDHMDEETKNEMRAAEEEILRSVGLTR
ncbi:MAG: rRNA maturation RNase YbeY [Clostridia bacterium]|nr:rRNA maturation RNase YbeY [Clostridia bacterium]